MSQTFSVIIKREVRPGKEREFEETLVEFFGKTTRFPGSLGVHVVRPLQGGREYGIMRTFGSREACQAFYASDEYREWEKLAEKLTVGKPKREEASGLEAWFAPTGALVVVVPPKWKVAVATLLGVLPTSIGVGSLLMPHLAHWPFFARELVFCPVLTLSLTYVVMPVVRRILGSWVEGKQG